MYLTPIITIPLRSIPIAPTDMMIPARRPGEGEASGFDTQLMFNYKCYNSINLYKRCFISNILNF